MPTGNACVVNMSTSVNAEIHVCNAVMIPSSSQTFFHMNALLICLETYKSENTNRRSLNTKTFVDKSVISAKTMDRADAINLDKSTLRFNCFVEDEGSSRATFPLYF